MPAPSFTETDPSAIESDVLTDYEERAARTLFDGDPVRLILETVAYALAQQRSEIQQAATQNLIQYASGAHLELLAELYDLTRRPAQPAETTLAFSTDGSPAGSDITIPQGTRVAVQDGSVTFATDEEATLASGDTSVSVEATAQQAGAKGNGLVAGQVSQIVDPIAGIATAQNTTETAGGADTESDDALRARVRRAPETFAVAGPRSAYEARARAAHPDVVDVVVYNNGAGEVALVVLMEGGAAPTTDEEQAILAALSAADARPLTDVVSVETPLFIDYAIDLTYIIDSRFESDQAEIAAAVDDEVTRYAEWQSARMARDINPDALEGRLLFIDGIKRVELTAPAVQTLAQTEVASLTTKSVTFGGFEDE